MINIVFCIILISLDNGVSGTFQCPIQTRESALPPPDILLQPQYTFYVNVNCKDCNETFTIQESYSSLHDDYSPYVYASMKKGSGANSSYSSNIYFDFYSEQSFYVNLNAKHCVVTNLTSYEVYYNHSIFGIGIENGLQKELEYPFDWRNPNKIYTLEGETQVNGIPVLQYSTCSTFNGGEIVYYVDLYMSKSGWEMPQGQNVPVKLKLVANMSLENNNFVTKEYTFLFKSFSTNNEAHLDGRIWHPQQPHGIVCPGTRFPPDLPFVPLTYSAVSETFSESLAQIYTYKEWYYLLDSLFRKDYQKPISESESQPFTEIHDFSTAVRYLINKSSGTCEMLPLQKNGPRDFDIEVDPTDLSSIHMLNTHSQREAEHLKYTGTVMHSQGKVKIPLMTWKSDLIKPPGEKYNMLKTYLYVADYKTVSNINPYLYGINTKVNGTHNGTYYTMDFYTRFSDISNNRNKYYDPFDVSVCFPGDKKKTFVLKFIQTEETDVIKQSLQFRHNLRKAVVEAAKISPLQVSKKIVLHETKIDDDEQNYLYAAVTLHEGPTVHGNTREYKQQTNLTEGIANLERVVLYNKLTVSFHAIQLTADGDYYKLYRLTAFPDFFKTSDEFYASKYPRPGKGSLTDGAVAGLCIAMLILGVIIGIIAYKVKVITKSAGNGDCNIAQTEL